MKKEHLELLGTAILWWVQDYCYKRMTDSKSRNIFSKKAYSLLFRMLTAHPVYPYAYSEPTNLVKWEKNRGEKFGIFVVGSFYIAERDITLSNKRIIKKKSVWFVEAIDPVACNVQINQVGLIPYWNLELRYVALSITEIDDHSFRKLFH